MADIPESLRRAGITSVSHDIPDGCSVGFTSDFVRIFRADLEQRLYGWDKPPPAVLRNGASRTPTKPSRSEP